jgi:hypothetical protein
MLEAIQDGSNSVTLHWYGYKEVWQPPYPDTPPEQVWGECHGRVYLFLFSEVEVLIIRYDKMVSHMTPTCAFAFVIKACDPGKDRPYHLLDMCTL